MSQMNTRVLARRRIVVRVGLLALLVATAAACIFEQSDYQGGGRLDHGATASTASATSSATPDASTPDAADASPLDGAPIIGNTPGVDGL